MNPAWRLVGGLVAIFAAGYCLWQGYYALGIIALTVALALTITALSRARETVQIIRYEKQIQIQWEDIVRRLRRGEGLHDIAADYARLHSLPPTRTLRFIAYRLLHAIGRGQDPDLMRTCAFLFKPKDPTASAEKFIETFDMRQTVYFVAESVSSFADEQAGSGRKRGLFVISRGYVYFFVDPEELPFAAAQALSIGKHHLVHLAHIPFLGVLYTGYEAAHEVAHELNHDFSSNLITELKKRYRLPGSLAIPLTRIVGVSKISVTNWLDVVRDRLVIEWRHETGGVSTNVFGFPGLFDDVPTDAITDAIIASCLVEGHLLVR